jgi:putative glutamine amidotransferase
VRRPVIGVVPLSDGTEGKVLMYPGYIQGLEEAGAVPVILPLTVSERVLKQIADLLDGFLFTGGSDLDPEWYGCEKAGYCGEVCETRDQMEAYLFREAVLNQNKPALGICRGIQLFNAFLGGSLYQDLPAEFSSAISHKPGPPYDVPAHAVLLLPESPLCKLAGKERLEVNSDHHQGISRIAERLEVMALADDGLVEAVYMPDHPYVWAVQWHPELLLEDETSKKLFASFVKNVERVSAMAK